MTVDEYISGFPDKVRSILRQIRSTIRQTAPGVEERISYGIPTFDLDGKPLIYFAAYAKHVSVYPAPRGYAEFRDELSAYKGGKGTVQFPLAEPIPWDLIRRIVEFRMEQHAAKRGAAKRKPAAGRKSAPKPKKRT